MSLTTIRNLRHEALLDRIAQLGDINAESAGVFRYVLVKDHNHIWQLLMGVLSLTPSQTARDEQVQCHRYPNFQFVSTPVDKISLSDLLHGLDSHGSLAVLGFSEQPLQVENVNWNESLIPSHASSGEFPERCFSGRLFENVSCQDSKLVAHGMPFHASAFEYVRDFLGLEQFHGSSDARKGELMITLTDRRGRIELFDHGVQFRTETADRLWVVGAVDGEPVNLSDPHNIYAFELEKASGVELWLVTDSDEIIDYCSTSEWEYGFGVTKGRHDQKLLFDIIERGESEHCEFKPYISLVAKDKKAWEIERTVCAFSNHQGGRLFIGVDDETRIIGINQECRRDYGCDSKEAAKQYEKNLTKRLRESLAKNQCFDTYLIEKNSLIVLVVEVHKADELNYLHQNDVAYARRGASSRRMTLAEVKLFRARVDPLGREQGDVF